MPVLENRTMYCRVNILLLLVLLFVFHIRSTSHQEPTAVSSSSFLLRDSIPELHSDTHNSTFHNITVYFLPESEDDCQNRYNYICRFWFYVRCIVFHYIPRDNFRVITKSQGGLQKTLNMMKPNDILIFPWRSSNHKLVPPVLQHLLNTKHKDNSSIVSKIRYGVFHIANERNRRNWTWYKIPHFVLRNYWVHGLPENVQYIPLGPQMPVECEPNSFYDEIDSSRECQCSESFKLTKSSDRKYVWSFPGSLRGSRKHLLNQITKNENISKLGLIYIASKFGGDGTFGSNLSDKPPKTKYLDIIRQSAFVFSPCGNVMETHRIYEAIVLGAIPVIEHCDKRNYLFFPHHSLLFDGAKNMITYVDNASKDLTRVDAQQLEMLSWWKLYMDEIGRNVSRVLLTDIPYRSRQVI